MSAPRHTRVTAALIEARGRWVNSDLLSTQLGIGKAQVAAAICEARAKGVAIQTHKYRGVGWRIDPAGAAAATAQAAPPAAPDIGADRPASQIGGPAAQPAAAAPPPLPRHRAHRAAIDLLAALLPATAEKVRTVALEAGEPVQNTLHRLIDYGIEVNLDLIVAGEHPLQLGRAA